MMDLNLPSTLKPNHDVLEKYLFAYKMTRVSSDILYRYVYKYKCKEPIKCEKLEFYQWIQDIMV